MNNRTSVVRLISHEWFFFWLTESKFTTFLTFVCSAENTIPLMESKIGPHLHYNLDTTTVVADILKLQLPCVRTVKRPVKTFPQL